MSGATGEPIASERPKASFVVITYNHVEMIGRCLDAFLAQDVDFPVEMIVHDDASTDGTVEVLRQYERDHPGRFTLLLQEKNGASAGAAMSRALTAANGEYVLFCDGDDHWNDPAKARTQVEFLDANPELQFCFHAVHRYLPDGTHVSDGDATDFYHDWTSEEVAQSATVFIPQQAIAFRNVLKPYPPEMWLSPLSDVFLTRVVAHAGGGVYLGDRIGATVSFLHPTSDYASRGVPQQDRMAKVTYLLVVAWLLRTGHDQEAARLIDEPLVPRLTGSVGPPAPYLSWRHPGSVLLVVRHWWTWGRYNRRSRAVAA